MRADALVGLRRSFTGSLPGSSPDVRGHLRRHGAGRADHQSPGTELGAELGAGRSRPSRAVEIPTRTTPSGSVDSVGG